MQLANEITPTVMVPMGVKKQWLLVSVVVCIGIGYLYSLSASDRNTSTGFRPAFYQFVTSKSADINFEMTKHVQNIRIKRVWKACGQTSLSTTGKYNRKSNPIYYFSPMYNITFCKVPKCGSTFWVQAFEILDNGVEHADEVFTRARVRVHGGFKEIKNISADRHLKQALVVFVSRDPYSRLFSAYIDKFYLPLMAEDNIFRNTSRGNECPRNVSFQMFLENVVNMAFDGEELNDHWAPISSLCRPCEYNKMLLVKQETFANDMEYALKVLHVEKNKEKILLDKLYGQRVQSTIPGLVETVYYFTTRSVAMKCIGYHSMAERIWRSFQIQGYLKDTVSLPKDIATRDLHNASYLSERIMDVIATNPLSRDDQKAQRRAALVDAYQKVDRETIKKIQKIYKTDFAMFDYSELPPLDEN